MKAARPALHSFELAMMAYQLPFDLLLQLVCFRTMCGGGLDEGMGDVEFEYRYNCPSKKFFIFCPYLPPLAQHPWP